MEKHSCRLCGRRFHNGRALGGHMRSHAPPARAPSVSSSSSLEGVQDRESETGSPLASTVSDAALEEDVAISLMMLSRDFWSSLQSKGFDDDDEHEMGPARPARQSRYQCGTCKRVFRSYQALGGHRASHKKGTKGSIPSNQIHGVASSGNNAGKTLRSHPTPSFTPSPKIPSLATLIDLNLPAPMEDDVEHSTVSDAHPW